MKLKIGFLTSVIFVLAPLATAQAQWIDLKKGDSVFDTSHMVGAMSGTSMAAVMCDGEELSVRLLVPERWDNKLAIMSSLFRLAFSVDGGARTLAAMRMEESGGMGTMTLAVTTDATQSKEIAAAISTARQRIDFALEVGGKFIHASRFTASGSGRVSAVVQACEKK